MIYIYILNNTYIIQQNLFWQIQIWFADEVILSQDDGVTKLKKICEKCKHGCIKSCKAKNNKQTNKKFYVSKLLCVSVKFNKVQDFVFCILYVKINMKRYDRHNKTHWTTDFLNSGLWFIMFVLYLVHVKIKFKISYWTNQLKLDTSAVVVVVGGGKCKKMHLVSGFPICHKLWDICFICF